MPDPSTSEPSASGAAVSSPTTPRLAQSISGLGDVLVDLQLGTEAEPLLREAFDIQSRILVEDSPELAVTQGRLGRCLATIGKVDEGLTHLSAAYDTLVKQVGEDDHRTRNVAAALARANGTPSKAVTSR